MSVSLHILWLFVLSIPVACVASTVTHEEAFREPREYCQGQCERSRSMLRRKFFYLFTCEYCLHYVAVFFLIVTGYKLFFADWRGSLIALFALLWIAHQSMSIYNRLRLDIKHESVEIEADEEPLKRREGRSTQGGMTSQSWLLLRFSSTSPGGVPWIESPRVELAARGSA